MKEKSISYNRIHMKPLAIVCPGINGPIQFLVLLFSSLREKICRAVVDSRGYCHTVGKIRRFVLVHCKKDYVQRQLQIRQGECRQCGSCCNLVFTCPMLARQGNCRVYGTCRPQACKVFPIDQRDIDEIRLCGHQCGYRFTGKALGRIGTKEEI